MHRCQLIGSRRLRSGFGHKRDAGLQDAVLEPEYGLDVVIIVLLAGFCWTLLVYFKVTKSTRIRNSLLHDGPPCQYKLCVGVLTLRGFFDPSLLVI
jgi:hypothetical protein